MGEFQKLAAFMKRFAESLPSPNVLQRHWFDGYGAKRSRDQTCQKCGGDEQRCGCIVYVSRCCGARLEHHLPWGEGPRRCSKCGLTYERCDSNDRGVEDTSAQHCHECGAVWVEGAKTCGMCAAWPSADILCGSNDRRESEK